MTTFLLIVPGWLLPFFVSCLLVIHLTHCDIRVGCIVLDRKDFCRITDSLECIFFPVINIFVMVKLVMICKEAHREAKHERDSLFWRMNWEENKTI